MKKIFLKKKMKKDENGFTLVESLIAITILMISIAAPLNLASKGLMAASIAQKQIVAFYLAQDATEAIINVKSSNKISNNGIIDGLKKCKKSISPNGCYIDTISIDPTGSPNDIAGVKTCNPGGRCTDGKLYKVPDGNPGEGLYRYSSSAGPFSGFTRHILIEEVGTLSVPVKEVKITTTVWWQSANGTIQTYVLETNVTN